jgi:iron complex transport system substrate-binding protein
VRGLDALVAILALAVPDVHGASARDDRGKTIELATPPARIVALAPNLAELAFAAGAGERLIAVSSATEFPEAASRLPVVTHHGRVDLERLLSFKPDLVLAWQTGNPMAQVQRIEELGIKVFVAEPRRLPDIARLLRALGSLAGTPHVAESSAARFEDAIAQMRNRSRNVATLAAFVEIWHAPLITVNGTHLISDTLALCGARNVFADAAPLTPVVSREALLARPVDVVISGAGAGAADAARVRSDFYAALFPARQPKLVAIDPALFHSQGPRLLQGAMALCAELERLRSTSSHIPALPPKA